MKHRPLLTVLLAATLSLTLAGTGYAAEKKKPEAAVAPCPGSNIHFTVDGVNIVGAEKDSPVVAELLTTYSELVQASNQHNLGDILKHYNPQFISGDNLSLQQIKDLIQETWQAYPDICYDSKPLEIRVNGDWATVESSDHSTATAPPDKDILNLPGRMVSDSRSMLFLRRIGNTWEITSDSTLWEQATIRYGIGDEVQVILSTPEQVKAGESYSATVRATVPEGTFSIATIDNQTLTYPHEKADDKFRTLGGENNELQRVLKANTQNRNELVTATLGLTYVDQQNPDRPSLSLNGIATIVKRVNVVPITTDDLKREMTKTGQVSTSASGKFDASQPESTEPPAIELPAQPEAAPPQHNEDGGE